MIRDLVKCTGAFLCNWRVSDGQTAVRSQLNVNISRIKYRFDSGYTANRAQISARLQLERADFLSFVFFQRSLLIPCCQTGPTGRGLQTCSRICTQPDQYHPELQSLRRPPALIINVSAVTQCSILAGAPRLAPPFPLSLACLGHRGD